MPQRLFPMTDRAMRVLALAGMAVLGIAIAVTVADIALRATVNAAILGTVDITQLCVMGAAFWSIPYAFTRDGHVSVEIGTSRLPPRLRHVLDALAALLGVLFMGLIGWYGWDSAALALDYGDVSQNLALPMIWYWGFLLSGAALGALAVLLVALRHLALAVTGDDTPDAEKQP